MPLLLLFGFFLWLNCSVAKESEPDYVIPKLNFNGIDEFMKSVLKCKANQIGAMALAIAQLDDKDNIQQSMANAYGKTVLTDPNSPNADGNSRFCIASISKQITAQTVGKVLELNNKTFDAKLKDLLPNSYKFYSLTSPYLAEKLTLRDLLSHRTAIGRHDTAWLYSLKTPREKIWSNLYHLNPMEGDLASNWRSTQEYNNWMVSLAAYAASLLYDPSGKTKYEDLVRKFIFEPLKLDSAVFVHDNHGWTNFAVPALNNGSGWSPMDLYHAQTTGETISPAGSICLSAADMVKFIQHVTRTSESPENAPSRATVYETFSPSNCQHQDSFSLKDPNSDSLISDTYGMGWWIGSYRGVRIITHTGDAFGYHNVLTVLPAYKAAVFFGSTNDPFYSYSYAGAVGNAVVDMLLNKTLGPNFVNDTICPLNLPPISYNKTDSLNCAVPYDTVVQKLVGVYKNPTFDDMIVDFNQATKQFRLYFGELGTITLCTDNKGKPGEYFLKVDSNSSLAILNADVFASNSSVQFDSNQSPIRMTATFIEARANPPPIYVMYMSGEGTNGRSSSTASYMYYASNIRSLMILFVIPFAVHYVKL